MTLKVGSQLFRKYLTSSTVSKVFFTTSQTKTKNVNPFKRTGNTLLNDLKIFKDVVTTGKSSSSNKLVLPSHCDVLIIGAGIMGSSIAYHLKERTLDGLDVVVVERDYSFKTSATTLSVGGLRQQFSLKENIELSLYSAEFLRNIKLKLDVEGADPPDIQFNPAGYLFLATDNSAHILEENVRLQKSLGAKVELLSPTQLKEKFPWMQTDGLALGSHGLENEGWFDPWSLLSAFRRKAADLGAAFVQGELVGFTENKTAPNLSAEDGTFTTLQEAMVMLPGEDEVSKIKFGLVIIAAGPWSGEVGKLAGMGIGNGPLAFPLPVQPRKRYVYNIHCPDGPGMLCPLVIDPSGTYFRREGYGGHYLCGRSPYSDKQEPPTDDLEVDYTWFEEQVWPLIAMRAPCFENAKIKSAWAGFYDFNSFDENAFVGVHPGFNNVLLATGFSGHGIQQSPAIGRAVTELIIDGRYKTIDLSRFGFQRVLENEPLWESNIV